MCVHAAILFFFPASMRALSPTPYLRIVVQSIGGSVTEPPPPVTAAVSSHSVPSHRTAAPRRPPRDRAGTVRISPRFAWKQTTWKSEPELRVYHPSHFLPDLEDSDVEIFRLTPGIRISISAWLKDSD